MYSPERERYLVEYEEDDTEVGPLSALPPWHPGQGLPWCHCPFLLPDGA